MKKKSMIDPEIIAAGLFAVMIILLAIII